MVPKRVDLSKVKYFEDRTDFFMRNCKPQDKPDFVQHTFIGLCKDGWSVCTSGKVVRGVENMMPFASKEAILCLLKAFTKELESLFNTKFAYHVLHAALRHCINHPDFRQDELISLCIFDYLDFMWDNYATFLHHSHSSPALRIYLQLLSGVNITKSPHTGLYEVEKITLNDPLDHKYIDRITDLTNRFLLSEAFNTFVVDPMAGPFLQTLIIVCWKRLEKDFEAICSNILRKSQLLKTSEDGEVLKLNGNQDFCLPMGFSHPVAIFFLETLISLLPGRLFKKFLANHILSQSTLPNGTTASIASALAGHNNACRVLRATIRAIKRAVDLEAIMSALQLPGGNKTEVGLKVALGTGQHYLLIALAEASRRCNGSNAEAIQVTCEKMLLETFGFDIKSKKPDDRLIKSIVKLKVHSELKTSDEESQKNEGTLNNTLDPESGRMMCNLAGCILAETLLGFTRHRPTRLASSLASLSAAEMFTWARDKMLHRVIESALLSPSVPDQRKLQIFACLKERLGILAMTQSGSRVVEALWRSSEASASKPSSGGEMSSLREEIARSLAPVSDRLAGSKFGRFVENLVVSAMYRVNPQRWRQFNLASTDVNATTVQSKGSKELGMKRQQSSVESEKQKYNSKKRKH